MSGPRRPVAAVLRALGLGDLLVAVPALRAIRRGLPDHDVVLLAPARFAGLVRHAELADRLVPLSATSALPRSLPASLEAPDVAVNLHGRGPQSHRLLLATDPHRLIAYASPGLFDDGPSWDDGEHEMRRWSRLATTAGFPVRAGDFRVSAPDRPIRDRAAGATIIHPGAAAAARRWPPERWAELAAAERASGHDVIVTTGPGERNLGRHVARAGGLPRARAVDIVDVLDLLALVHGAGRLVCGDTGVAHVATAVGTPSVVLFGPTSPAQWGPPPGALHRALWHGWRGDPQAAATDPGLLAIGVAEVREALATLPARVDAAA